MIWFVFSSLLKKPFRIWCRFDLFLWGCVSVADGVDGKQARRTNSSTPLGELFDHGLDSWSCVYFVVTVYSIFGRGSSGVSVFVLYLLLWVVLFSFILSHWEKYNTGVLFLPWGYDISQVVSMCFNLNCQHCMNLGGKFLSFFLYCPYAFLVRTDVCF